MQTVTRFIDIGVILHLRNYASAGLLSAVAGVVSFPILTRSLSVEQYGILGLITSSLTLFIAFGKLGFQHAVIRFFAQVKNATIAFSPVQLHSTVSFVFLALALCTTALWLGAGLGVLPLLLQYEHIEGLFLIAAGTVFIRMLGSGVMNFLRAEQRSGEVALVQILARYLNLALIIMLLFIGSLRPFTILACLLVAEIVAVAVALYRYRPGFRFSLGAISGPLAGTMLVYGVPLMILESLGLVLRLSDRYLIEAIRGVNDLGMYSASYNLTAYIDVIVIAGLVQAVKPLYMQLWESSEPERTQQFLARGFRLYLLTGLPAIALIALASPHAMNVLASPKYAEGTVIIPFVAISFLLDGAMVFLGAGLYIHKNTRVLMHWGLLATVINLALNVLFIPRFGILGAAMVTIVSYAVFVIGVGRSAFRLLPFDLPWRTAALTAMASLALYAALFSIDTGSDLGTLLVKSFTGGALVVIALVLIDTDVRNALLVGWQRLTGQRAAP